MRSASRFSDRIRQPPSRHRLISGASVVLLALVGCGREASAPTDPGASGTIGDVAAAATYTIRDLGTLGGAWSQAHAINNHGVIVGTSEVPGGAGHAFLYRAGRMQDLGALAGGQSDAVAVNDSGVVVGSSTVLSGARRAVRWKNGGKLNLGTLGGRNSAATGVNLAGIIVGWSETASGDRHAFVWKNGVMTDLGTLGGRTSQASGINRAGKIVGSSATASGEGHAFVWKDGIMKDLGTQGHEFSFATAINTAGQITGSLGPPPDAQGEDRDVLFPFLFSREVWTRLGTGEPRSVPQAISSEGVIVGYHEDLRSEDEITGAWVHESGMSQRLPRLSEGLTVAHGVNRFGTIVGYSESADRKIHAVLWRRQ
jgi:probable HAF family extracellular repeat protein